MLLVATLIWRTTFYYVLQEYGMSYVLTVDLFLFFAWWVFVWHCLLNLKLSEVNKATREISIKAIKVFIEVRRLTYASVLGFFKTLNRERLKAKSSTTWGMKLETTKHVGFLIKTLKWVVLPVSLFYICAGFYFFGQNTLDSMFLGILIFVYSNFLPDLPSIYRKKKGHRDTDLPWYKKYALLLLAPVFIVAFFLGLKWRTSERFHNFKSAMIYGAFLFTLSLFAFGVFPIFIISPIEIVSLPLYGMIGYLTHLKVDKIW